MVTIQIKIYNKCLCLMLWLQIWSVSKTLSKWPQNYIFVVEDYLFHLFATHNHIFLYQKCLIKLYTLLYLKQIALNHSSNIRLWWLYDKKCTNELYSFLNTNIMFPSDHPLHFRKSLIDDIPKRKIYFITWQLTRELQMKICKYEINREGAKISTLPSGKINKYEYWTCE